MPGYSQNRDNLLLRDAQITASDVISIKDCFLSGNGKKSDSGVHREVGKHRKAVTESVSLTCPDFSDAATVMM